MLRTLIEQTAPTRPAGDEKVFRDPSTKYWNGASHAGEQMSICPPDYLLALAKYKGACVFMAKKEGDPTKAQYIPRDEATAKLAAEWAAYLERNGVAKSAPRSERSDEELFSDEPF